MCLYDKIATPILKGYDLDILVAKDILETLLHYKIKIKLVCTK